MKGVLNLARDEDINRWLRRLRDRRRIPFLGSRGFEDIDKMFDEMFKEIAENIHKNLIGARKLLSGGKIREIDPFVY